MAAMSMAPALSSRPGLRTSCGQANMRRHQFSDIVHFRSHSNVQVKHRHLRVVADSASPVPPGVQVKTAEGAVTINGQALVAETSNDAPENSQLLASSSPDGYHGWKKPNTSPFLSIMVRGATGDLARNKIFPDLFALYYSGNLYKNVAIFGHSQSELSDDEFRDLISESATCRVDGDQIDHHLGKELIKNLTVLRFPNLVFEPLWCRTCIKSVQGFALQAAAAVAAGVLLWGGSNALAADPLKTCSCLLKECRVELAKCIADPKCAANVACLQTCNGRPDETECQIGCGDLFENDVVDQFNDCAVTRKGCVPQKPDEGRFPVPSPQALVPEFDTTRFTGTWYITSGLNKTFDTFDCQKHEFSAEPTTLSGNLSWRIPTPDGGFFTRSTVQNFVQDPKQPGILYNHGNEFLHYQDDWYILDSSIENKEDDFVFIFYRGKNDAWDGYGGAVVYTRSPTLPASIIPKLQAAAKRVNLDFNKFTTTNNACGPEPPLFARLEKKVEEGERFVEKEVQEGEKYVEQEVEQGESLFVKVGQKFVALFGNLGKGAEELRRDEERFFQELGEEEKQILKDLEMDASDVGKLFGNAIPLRKLR